MRAWLCPLSWVCSKINGSVAWQFLSIKFEYETRCRTLCWGAVLVIGYNTSSKFLHTSIIRFVDYAHLHINIMRNRGTHFSSLLSMEFIRSASLLIADVSTSTL